MPDAMEQAEPIEPAISAGLPAEPPPQPVFAIDGNRLTLLDTGPRRLDTLLGLIEGARKSLRLLYLLQQTIFLEPQNQTQTRFC